MLFEVDRASKCYDYWNIDQSKPHERCIQIQIPIPDDVSESTMDYINHIYEGQVHGGVVTTWGIEINSLEELMDFEKSLNHCLILGRSGIDDKTPIITIYDDYIE